MDEDKEKAERLKKLLEDSNRFLQKSVASPSDGTMDIGQRFEESKKNLRKMKR